MRLTQHEWRPDVTSRCLNCYDEERLYISDPRPVATRLTQHEPLPNEPLLDDDDDARLDYYDEERLNISGETIGRRDPRVAPRRDAAPPRPAARGAAALTTTMRSGSTSPRRPNATRRRPEPLPEEPLLDDDDDARLDYYDEERLNISGETPGRRDPRAALPDSLPDDDLNLSHERRPNATRRRPEPLPEEPLLDDDDDARLDYYDEERLNISGETPGPPRPSSGAPTRCGAAPTRCPRSRCLNYYDEERLNIPGEIPRPVAMRLTQHEWRPDVTSRCLNCYDEERLNISASATSGAPNATRRRPEPLPEEPLLDDDDDARLDYYDEERLNISVLEPASFSVSADRRFLLLAQGLKRIHRHSYLARYTVYDILTTESYPLTPLPDEVGGVITEGPHLLLATWTPKGHGLITVKDYDIYYRPAPRSSTGYRVTETGIPGTIHNGVPDWLYEEEVLKSRSALWMSADGHMVLYATFNDTLVHEQKFSWYGPALDTDDPSKTYPEIRSVRYPKPGTNNPTVTLTVADIADPKHIRTRHLTPPKVIIEEGDYYFTSAQWVSLTEVCVVWLTRTQNLSVVSVCKSPMWYCQEVYRISSGNDGWVESAPSPLWSAGGGALVTLAPIRDGPAGLFRHIVRTEHNAHGPRALPLTHGSFDVVKLLAWDHTNQHIYYLGIPEGKPGQQHLYRVSSEPPRPGSPQKLPYCVTCNSQPSPSINLEYYGSLASSGDSTWDADWDEELPTATSPSPSNKKRKKKHPEGMPQNLPCLYHEAHFSPSSAYFVLECLGPGVPTSSLHKSALPEPRALLHLENNTAVKERLSSIALPTPRTFSVQLSSGHAARVRLLLPPGLREDEVTKYPLVLMV
ncbi:inactive dipeptidyl peptidase 10-like [Ostrinia furnacalis]|uniref:inactive dipeptidyl peptidase 10-like n=1 Tax=Ostrinia furnacalis TaxID=93504 RepID=UPI00103B29B7|nr:inactive dipeptidyl peptidase 10-like [Ostrinia furnacalis]